MNELKIQLIESLEGILRGFGISAPSIVLEHPEKIDFGDYTTNIALVYSKELQEKPFILAEKIVEALKEKNIAHIEKIDIAGPGFINVTLDRTFFSEALKQTLATDKFGSNTTKKDSRISIEYTNTNVLKPLHIGHLMGNVIGESLSRIIEISGAEVKRNTYQGDVGLHVAKAVWGMRASKDSMPTSDISVQSDFIGKAYATGAEKYESDPVVAEEIKKINKQIFEKSDPEIMKLYEWGRKISLEHFEVLYKKLGTKFDYYFFESEVADPAVKIVREFLKKGVFTESEGAIVFRGEDRDAHLHTRVFLSSQGLPTYEAKDIAHAIRKYEKYPFDQALIVTANEQNEYFKVMLCALGEIVPEVASKTKHISHGLLKLTTGKMSSRKGNVITGEELIKDMEERAQEKLASRELSVEDKQIIAEQVAIAAIKYSILRQASGSDIVFDPEQSLSFEGDSGPYLQYTAVRAQSVLQKAKKNTLLPKASLVPPEVTELEKILYRFPEIVLRASQEYAPHYLVTYLTRIASTFNSWYANNQIIEEKDPYTPYRLAIVSATHQVLVQGLTLLGMPVPEKM